jgi:exosome complex component RRP41
VEGTLVLDINEEEDMYGEADMPIAVMPGLGQITLIQLNGVLMEEEIWRAVELGMKGARIVYEAQKEALRKRYSSAVE